jgi:hypothetical protein
MKTNGGCAHKEKAAGQFVPAMFFNGSLFGRICYTIFTEANRRRMALW